jgi:DNA ligase-1
VAGGTLQRNKFMNLPTLYSRTSTGAVQTWTIEIDGGRYRTIYGQINGKKTTSEWYVAISTNVGRANERNAAEQAEFEAAAIWKKRTETGYHADIANIDNPTMIDCMLANKWEDKKDTVKWPVWTQPKLDGIRCLATVNGLFSRNGKTFSATPHISNALEKFFDKHPDVILDGELYCDKFANDFNKICSLVKKTKPTPEDLKEAAKTIEYHVYDMVDTAKLFEDRVEWLIKKLFTGDVLAFGKIKPVLTKCVQSNDELDCMYAEFLDAGYEGQMVRINGVYEQKRSKFLLKRKEFQDGEYKILEVCEGTGNRTGMAGWMVLENTNKTTFKSNIKGPRTFLKQLLDEKKHLVEQYATVQYFQLTPDGVPRFPYVISIRNYE